MPPMKLNEYLKGKNRKAFARDIGTSVHYLNNLCSDSVYVPGRKMAARIEEATGGAVSRLELLYPDKNAQG